MTFNVKLYYFISVDNGYLISRRENKTKEDYVVGSGNVFKDLDFDDPEEESAKVKLASIIKVLK